MRVVSIVPSLTEAVALTAPSLLAGATDYCTHPAGLDVPRVGGSKYPDLPAVLALKPDLVLMNEEENRLSDAEALRAAGVAVHVTFPLTVDQALAQLSELMQLLGHPDPAWLADARRAWADLPDLPRREAVIPVWRRPWIVLGSGTFAGDVLDRLGITNVFGTSPERYPRPALGEMTAPLIVFPDEPYLFTLNDGPECFPSTPYVLVSGRHLTWHGPSLAQAPRVLAEQLLSVRDRS
ncbi:helical backbone metal receptor [Catelliglobosispora koreensis]|uniref:helical backbone metal receptor n=1 Tax=Catelliglobosispora koreensis TaxID=129052 RepID=UPI000476D33F|nr:helical backbone metal receptor [Catelliglobosispora koreensis]